MKKLVSLILTAIMIASVTAFSVSAAETYPFDEPFIDVKKSRWSYEAVSYVSEKGYMDGVGGGKFNPAAPMTRAMVVTVLYRREGEPAVTFKNVFSDVKDGKWYSKAVIWASNRGIVNGVSEGIFDPNGKITREQLVTMLHRYCDVKLLDVSKRADLGVFTDKNKIHSYAAESFAWAVGEGLISGMTKDTAAPRGNATREQFAMILKRFDDAPFVLKERGSVREKYCTVEYIIKYPDGYDHKEKRPLLVFLHGSGSSGTGLDELYNNSFFQEIAKVEDFPFIVLAPQLYEQTENRSAWPDKRIVLDPLIRDVVSSREVDASRVYIMGTSLGGYGTWYYAASMNDVFSAAVPICGGGSTSTAKDLVNVPIWAFHGTEDEAVPYQLSVDMVNAVNEAGGNAKLTSFEGMGHGGWDEVYHNPEVYEWMLSYHK